MQAHIWIFNNPSDQCPFTRPQYNYLYNQTIEIPSVSNIYHLTQSIWITATKPFKLDSFQTHAH